MRKFAREKISGARVDVKLLELGPPVDYPLEIRVIGSELETLRKIGNEIENLLKTKKGVISVENNFGSNSQKLVIKIDQGQGQGSGVQFL